jgi:hypothetical protein
MDPMTLAQRRERLENFRRSRQSIMRWRWVMIGLGGLLALALLANGNYLIGGILAALLVARLVMIARMQRIWNEREALFARRGNGAITLDDPPTVQEPPRTT